MNYHDLNFVTNRITNSGTQIIDNQGVNENSNRLILLHGFTQQANSFLHLIAEMQKQISIDHPNYVLEAITIDLPGHGANKDIELSPKELADQIATLGPAHILGYSLGGRSALLCAILHPEKVNSLILISATAGIEDPSEIKKRREDDFQLANEIFNLGDERLEEFLEKWLSSPLFSNIKSKQDEIELRKSNSAKGLAYSLMNHGQASFEPLWNRLIEVKARTLILNGSADEKYCAIGKKLQEEIDQSRQLIFQDLGHSLHLESPSKVTREVLAFITAQ
ncbi:MAG: alpha/beta fold hydrolase [Acidimicrobiales bacterium]|nr:alpha/beta fold hydrolase [Acidimicrobiales bacterium]